MNKTCARCEKTVYPTEELKCLDKVWHKGCFKCQECGMTLNMRTYKGYGKLPYCESHVPKAKHTTMAETPELKRIAENTKIQSNVKYHADFEKSKGKFTQVADDPETLRIKANTKIISNVAYHGDLEKKAHMERQRQINENGDIVETTDNYKQQIDNYATEMLSSTHSMPSMPQKNNYQAPVQPQNYYNKPQQQKYEDFSYQNTQYSNQYPAPPQYTNPPSQYTNPPSQYTNPPTQYANPPTQYTNPPTQYTNPPTQYPNPPLQYTNQPAHTQYNQNNTQSQSKYNQNHSNYQDYSYSYGQQQHQQQSYGTGQNPKIGRIQDYDPLSDGPRAPPGAQRATTTLIYNSTGGQKNASTQQNVQQSRPIGRVTDVDPVLDEPPAPHANKNQRVYIAMYDYEANDNDEVSFREGDLISLVTSIDEGWMTGQVLRTGRTGMLPANYVQLAPQY